MKPEDARVLADQLMKNRIPEEAIMAAAKALPDLAERLEQAIRRANALDAALTSVMAKVGDISDSADDAYRTCRTALRQGGAL